MSDIAISARHVSKEYVIAAVNHDTLRDRIAHTWRALSGRSVQRDVAPRAFRALNDLSFEVAEGEVLGVIGHNGAGKSTLLKILSRITEPSAGEVDLYGRVTSLLEVGTGFHAELTGRENVYLNAAMLGMRKVDIDRRFDAIVEFSGTHQFIDTPVKRYSSGMYVRLAFSVAAHLDPEILIVDEVLSVGDGAFQKKVFGENGRSAAGWTYRHPRQSRFACGGQPVPAGYSPAPRRNRGRWPTPADHRAVYERGVHGSRGIAG